ncbi:MAG: HIT family protein [Nitrososphaerota archaeon]|nr:HIT family protein [Nitrososphaerota archaeon]
MKFDDNCIFCKIVQKQAPSSILYEDGSVMAFLDIKPVNEGHALVISKAHYEGIFDIPSELLGDVHKVTKTIAAAVKQAVNADGVSIVQQNGKAANQEVFHIHVHIIPKFLGQKMNPFNKNDLQFVDHKQLDITAAKIKNHL